MNTNFIAKKYVIVLAVGIPSLAMVWGQNLGSLPLIGHSLNLLNEVGVSQVAIASVDGDYDPPPGIGGPKKTGGRSGRFHG